jgi:hypothetical protein
MTPIIIAAALSILGLDAAPAAAPPTPAAAPAPDQDKIICRSTQITGSRFHKRLCATKAQWAEFQRKQDQDMDNFFRKSNDNTVLPREGACIIPANGISQGQMGIPGMSMPGFGPAPPPPR